jgi:hypothetical protein
MSPLADKFLDNMIGGHAGAVGNAVWKFDCLRKPCWSLGAVAKTAAWLFATFRNSAIFALPRC